MKYNKEEILKNRLNTFINEFLDLAATMENRDRSEGLDEFHLKYTLKDLLSKNEHIKKDKTYPSFFKNI